MHLVRLSAERQGSGNSKTYTITITAKDALGNTKTEDIIVKVPKRHTGLSGEQLNRSLALIPSGETFVVKLLSKVRSSKKESMFIVEKQSALEPIASQAFILLESVMEKKENKLPS